jgi:hypothetical protein
MRNTCSIVSLSLQNRRAAHPHMMQLIRSHSCLRLVLSRMLMSKFVQRNLHASADDELVVESWMPQLVCLIVGGRVIYVYV